MDRVLLALGLLAAAGVVAALLGRRRPQGPTQGSWQVPTQLDRADFAGPACPWLVALFTSDTCTTCATAVEKAEPLASDAVSVAVISYQADQDLHRRYRIDAVPTVVVADADGVVHATFVGPYTATDLWSTVAELREERPGSGGEAAGS